MAVLEALARKPGELISRANLLAEIWPGGDIYDEALTQCVYQLRQQLLAAGGDDSYRNLITTVPKRGYVLKGEPMAVANEPMEASASRVIGKKGLLAVALSLVIVLLAAWAIFEWGSDSDSVGVPQQADSVAVLPFLPLVAEESQPVLELGMADTLITKLSGIRELVVRPMSSVRRYGDVERDSLRAGRQLGVNAVVDGSIQRSGDTLRVVVRLLRVNDGAALWAETISQPFGNIFSVQDEICARIAEALALKLGQDDRRELANGGTANTEAYEHYLQGRYLLARLTPKDLRESVAQFRSAVELDPDYTQAWLGLANVQFRIGIAGEAPPLEFYPKALEAAHRVLELEPSSAEAYAMLGWIAHWYDWDWAASEAYFKRAIELDPNETESHLGYAHLLTSLGRYEEAGAEVRRARELSPNYMLAAALEGQFLMGAGQREDALRQMEAARELGENLWLFRVGLAGVYAANGRLEDALAEYDEAMVLSGGSTWVMANKISLLLRMGRDSDAEAVFAELLHLAQERYVPAYNLALAYRTMGDLDSALLMLEQAYEQRDPKLVFITQGTWKPLGEEPRFQRLARELNLQAAVE